ncbi:hypothetical protein L5515_011039 [Caenorhabditis briggsae]|uniref:Carboxylesterase type B domain-containing protein n=1 Tax=Caenorhabditis briggsae TaxID=6238 RepID=A0AAE9ERW3_CAEBR|nr:hypothetical protein L5515_011039 [Caenorhabditis briggsae]
MYLNLILISLISTIIQSSTSEIISTSYGKLKGKQIGEYHLFKHVPFAKPPVGTLRFQKAETPEKWEGVRDAREYGPACMSNSTISKSPQKWVDEDCLHVNIFTSNKCLKLKNCAVVVYLHGGDLLFDSAVMFNDSSISETFPKNDVILVIPGFRLGIFSHFAVEDQSIAPNNIGLFDILKSLEFTKSEIHNFGGNNRKVTLFGHSYGGTIVTMLTFSTEVNRDLSLFQKAISMSSHQYFETLELHIQKTQKFSDLAGCLPSSTAEMTQNQKDRYTMICLQNKSAIELLRVQRSLEETGYPTLGSVIMRDPLFPDVKPAAFMDSPKMIPMLTGCSRVEFDHEPELLPLSSVFHLENSLECDEKYRKDLADGSFQGNHTDKTQAILVPTKMRVNKLLEKGIPTYLYEYMYRKHAKHSDDLYYLMGVYPFEEDENEVHLKQIYQQMITNFAKFGNPGNNFEKADFTKNSYYDLNWNETSGQRPKMSTDFEKKTVDYWLSEMVEYDRSVTEEKKKISPKTRSFNLSSNNKPESAKNWNLIRDATEYGPACMSNSTETSSIQKWVDEDCLHINIFTSNKCLKTKNCAVVAYIHGGVLIYDSAVMFNDTYLIDSFLKNGVILAIPAFRLGIFSHFTVQDQSIAPSNVAIYDILKSLEFIKKEIHNFGGDKRKVTLLGHSFGGTIASMFTFGNEVNPDLSLFQRTVVMSADQAFHPLELQLETTKRFVEYANCSVALKLTGKISDNKKDRIEMQCLQRKSGMELLRIQRSLEEAGYPTYGGIVQREPLFSEVKSSEYFGSPKKIPMLTGCTSFEFDHVPDECDAKYRKDVKDGHFDRDNHTDRTIAVFVSTQLRVKKLLKKGIPVYLYQLRYPKHVVHTDDLYYIMGVHPFEMDENEIYLREVYQNMVMNFVKNGEPGNGFEISDPKSSSYFEINWNETTGLRPHMSTDFEKKVMHYWGPEMTEFDKQITLEKQQKSARFRSSAITPYPIDSNSHLFLTISMFSLVFLLGFYAGKCCLNQDRNQYIQLYGNDFESI